MSDEARKIAQVAARNSPSIRWMRLQHVPAEDIATDVVAALDEAGWLRTPEEKGELHEQGKAARADD